MNLGTHLLMLGLIRGKLDRGEEPTEAEAAYVRWLWERIYPVARAMAQAVADAMGTTIRGAASRLDAGIGSRERAAIAREAMRKMRSTN